MRIASEGGRGVGTSLSRLSPIPKNLPLDWTDTPETFVGAICIELEPSHWDSETVTSTPYQQHFATL